MAAEDEKKAGKDRKAQGAGWRGCGGRLRLGGALHLIFIVSSSTLTVLRRKVGQARGDSRAPRTNARYAR
jgi:hypothetical protein